jgi:hypothetical protein
MSNTQDESGGPVILTLSYEEANELHARISTMPEKSIRDEGIEEIYSVIGKLEAQL